MRINGNVKGWTYGELIYVKQIYIGYPLPVCVADYLGMSCLYQPKSNAKWQQYWRLKSTSDGHSSREPSSLGHSSRKLSFHSHSSRKPISGRHSWKEPILEILC